MSCDSVKSLLSQLSREVGGDCEEQHRQAKEQIWNKLEVGEEAGPSGQLVH